MHNQLVLLLQVPKFRYPLMRNEWIVYKLLQYADRDAEGFVTFYDNKVNEFELIHFPNSDLNRYLRDKGYKKGMEEFHLLKKQRGVVRNRADFATAAGTTPQQRAFYLDKMATEVHDLAWESVQLLKNHKDCMVDSNE